MRAVRPGGRVVVFDKFAPDARPTSLRRRAVNLVTTLIGTEIDRRLSDVLAGAPCDVVSNDPSILGGQYRIVLLRRSGGPRA